MYEVATLHISSNLTNLSEVRRFIQQTAVALTNDIEAIGDLVLAVDEAITNIIVHGYQNGSGEIEVCLSVAKNALTIGLNDRAPAYDPTDLPIPDTKAPLGMRKPGGMGVHMIRNLVDEVSYERTPDGWNKFILTKYYEY
jgi:serine/threonine-protein kinase RsbW